MHFLVNRFEYNHLLARRQYLYTMETKFWMENPQVKRPPGRKKQRWYGTITKGPKEIQWE
jgi:hypothetical protein